MRLGGTLVVGGFRSGVVSELGEDVVGPRSGVRNVGKGEASREETLTRLCSADSLV